MNRKYDMARYMTLVEGLRAARPVHALSTDLIVGFPGETEEQFQETLDAVRAVNFMSSFSFCYSDRPGTAASRHTDKVEPAEKLRRLERLQALQEDLSSDWLKARVGCKTDILLEGASRKQDGEDAATESWQGRDRGATPSTSPCLPESANPASLCRHYCDRKETFFDRRVAGITLQGKGTPCSTFIFM